MNARTPRPVTLEDQRWMAEYAAELYLRDEAAAPLFKRLDGELRAAEAAQASGASTPVALARARLAARAGG